MPDTPLLTVAVAMYNSEDTVKDALESVYSQRTPGVEVVIVNDASTDNSLALAQDVNSHGMSVRFVHHDTNQGLGPARNSGISAAQGKYIVFLDSDDELLPGSLEAISAVAKDSNADLLLTGSLERKRGTDRSMNPGPLLRQLASSSQPWSVSDHPELFFWPPSTWAKVYRREFLVDNKIVFPPGFHQDIPSTVDGLLLSESVSAVDHPCYLYIRRGEGSSATRSKGTKTLVRISQIQRIRQRHDIATLPEPKKTYLVALVSVHLIWANRAAYRTMPEELHESFFHDSSEELSWWWSHAQPGAEVNSDALLPTKERIVFTKALLSNDWAQWNKALADYKRALKWQRYLDPTRWGIFKRS
jgi:glycosyltransferase involved in cell wall biosynthesis